MPRLLLFVLVTLLTVASSTPVHAQGPGGGQRFTVEERVAALKARLSLSDDQTEAVTGILTVSRDQMMKARDAADGDREAMRKSAREIQQKADVKIEALLTPDQKKEFAKLREEQAKQMRERQAQQQGGPR
jgi:hypothetical protein